VSPHFKIAAVAVIAFFPSLREASKNVPVDWVLLFNEICHCVPKQAHFAVQTFVIEFFFIQVN
jgi:hypothetical protein